MALTPAQKQRAIGEMEGVCTAIQAMQAYQERADAVEAQANAIIDGMLSVAAWRDSTGPERKEVLEAAMANNGADVANYPGYRDLTDAVRTQFEIQFAARHG